MKERYCDTFPYLAIDRNIELYYLFYFLGRGGGLFASQLITRIMRFLRTEKKKLLFPRTRSPRCIAETGPDGLHLAAYQLPAFCRTATQSPYICIYRRGGVSCRHAKKRTLITSHSCFRPIFQISQQRVASIIPPCVINAVGAVR